jgi:hypothetical protein
MSIAYHANRILISVAFNNLLDYEFHMLNIDSFLKSVFVFTILAVLTVSVTIAIVSFNISEAEPSLNISEAKPNSRQNLELASGSISSIQNNNQGKPEWVLSGNWFTNMINKTKDSFNQTNPARFGSSMSMVMLDGSAKHRHSISNFSLTDINSQGNTTSYKGTVTITLKEGRVNGVPIEIKVMNNNVIALSLDATKTNNHFGDTPIYGIISPKAGVTKVISPMGNKTMISPMGNKTMTDMHLNISQK